MSPSPSPSPSTNPLPLPLASPPSPSTTESSRAVITSYLAALNARDWTTLSSLFASPSTPYWVLGSPGDPPPAFAGTQPVSARLPQLAAVLGSFASFAVRVDALVAEGERVMLHGQVLGSGPGEGREYTPDVAMAFVVRAGRIVEKREYIDNLTVLEWVGRLEREREEREEREKKGEGEKGEGGGG